MRDWRFVAMGVLWLALGLALILRPEQIQAASKRFEQGKNWIPISLLFVTR
jgi:hypothetical protein